jgi:hypothetical protein
MLSYADVILVLLFMEPVALTASVTWAESVQIRRQAALLMLRSPLLELILADLPQLVDLRRFTRQSPLNHLHAPRNKVTSCHGIRDRLRLDLDHPNSWIFGAAVMLAISKITQPRL